MTFLVLDSITSKVVSRSELRSALTNDTPNLRAEQAATLLSADGETPASKPILSSTDVAGLDINPSDLKLPRFSPEELLGKTFLRQLDDGKSYRAKVIRKILDQDAENHQNIKFLLEIGDGKFD